METKQTAVQILVESMTTSDISFYSKEIAIALQMEREQIIDAYYEGKEYGFKEQGEQYYNETYGGQDE
jgi:hypothetical protein